MLTYLILTTRLLVLAVLVAALILGYTSVTYTGINKHIVWALGIVGVIFSMVISYLRHTTSLIDTAILNGCIYAVSIISFIIFLIMNIPAISRKDSAPVRGVTSVFTGIILFTAIAYAFPDYWGYPYDIYEYESTMLSTNFLLSILGMLFASILLIVLFFAVRAIALKVQLKYTRAMLFAVLLIYEILRLAGLFSAILQKQIVKSNHFMFSYSVFVKNHNDMFIFIAMAIVSIAAIGQWVNSFRQKEPYNNPAQHRLIRAKWRRIRRWATAALVTFALGICNLTVAEAMNKTDTTLSPIEDATSQDDENIYVSFDLVNDGHLHRFAYTTDDDVAIRFIIIQKSGNSYGVGLDACDVCGETGYYEKDGQVVCNLCDVVMNISTIGFKGGCNPIVIPYEINNGQIIVPISGLLEYVNEFK